MVVGTDGNAAAHVDDDKVQILVALAVLLGKAAGHGLLVQGVEDGAAGQFRHAGDAGLVGQLVDNDGVNDVAGDAQAVADLAGQDAAQVGSVLALDAGLQVSQQSVADGVGAAGDGLEQAAAADDDVQALGGAVLLFQKVQDDGLAEILLVDDTGVLGDLLRGMAQGFLKQQGLVLKNTNLGRGRTRVDDQCFNRHLKRLLLFYSAKPAATTAARAMELTFVWKESERLVRMAGTLVPVRMQPFLQSAVWTSVL